MSATKPRMHASGCFATPTSLAPAPLDSLAQGRDHSYQIGDKRMATYEVEQAAAILEELLDRVEAGETIGLTRDGRLVARLIPPNEPPSNEAL